MDKRSAEKPIIKLEHWQIIASCLMLADIVSIHAAYFAALWLRFDCVYSQIPIKYLDAYLHFITAYSVGAIVLFWFFHMYHGMWRYASYTEFMQTFMGSLVSSVVHTVLITALLRQSRKRAESV